jgi:hypothetical protein
MDLPAVASAIVQRLGTADSTWQVPQLRPEDAPPVDHPALQIQLELFESASHGFEDGFLDDRLELARRADNVPQEVVDFALRPRRGEVQ